MMVFWRTALRAAQRLVVPTLLAIGFAWLATRSDEITAAVGGATAALAWIHVAALWLGGCGLLVLLDEWPVFDRERRERRWLTRIVGGPWQGCLAASAGAAVAVAIGLSITGAAFGLGISADAPAVRAHVQILSAPLSMPPERGSAIVAIGSPLSATAIEVCAYVHHRPGDPVSAVELEILADGELLTPTPLESVSSSDRHRIEFAPRTIERLEIRRHEGSPALGVTVLPDRLTLASARSFGHAANVAIASLAYLVPLMLAMTFACVLRGLIGTAAAWFGTLATFAATSVLGLAPNIAAIDACVESRWVLAESFDSLGTLSVVGCAILLLLAIPRPKARR